MSFSLSNFGSERMSSLQFAPFSSAVDSGFWYQLTQKKLDVFKLDDGPVDMSGFYSTSSAPGLPPVFHVDYSALESSGSPLGAGVCCASGTLLNTNTLEDFKRKDKRALLQETAQQKIWAAIKDGRALQDPSLLQHCLCLTFADLKKYHYYYWMAFPALTFPKDVICEKEQKLADCFSPEKVARLDKSVACLDPCDRGAFLVGEEGGCRPLRERGSLQEKILLGFTDPSGFAKHPGWPLRNLLALAAHQWGGNSWEVVCFRGKAERSLLLSLRTEEEPAVTGEAVGWEMSRGKLVPKKVDMSESMDPHKLACNAVDLNLKLMRWRLSPGLELEIIKDTKCLLFGAGTLGCNVARCLMGWGVRHLTLVDNSRVSYSNPVRQSLFTFQDCKRGGVPKATAAAEHLREVFPGVEATGKVLSVPMPGHAVPESTWPQVKNDVAELEELVASHDVLFLLMDTRESRWLPSLLAAHHNKLVLNAALGFDTFLVMRHGMRKEGEDATPHLGCYFCNDVVAPGNSSLDRTLDQQCTVTRPGLSYVGAAMAVELLVSLLQHPLRGLAPASKGGECGEEGELGLVPHQVRGHLHNFTNSILASQGFDRCTACSLRVLECYRREGSDFLLRVFNDPDHLEHATGLSELCVGLTDDEIIALSDEESC